MGITKQSPTVGKDGEYNDRGSEKCPFGQNENGLGGTINGQQSLQEAFLKFKRARQKQLKQKCVKKRIKETERNEDMMKELRVKFVKQAKKYLGVPYAKRYHKPGSAEYDAPLFLDCCGLVRRVLRNLHQNFGFRIGPWNQAYMFDTLPNTIESVEDMKPGDLVFVSGIFYNSEMKKQRHNMVHVEIWAGDSEKTIGARWKRGRLQIHDSYQYVSKNYHSMVYHFKSIDTWLKGICKSFCSEHEWKSSNFTPGKKSIFAIEETDEDAESCVEHDNFVPEIDSCKIHDPDKCINVKSHENCCKRLDDTAQLALMSRVSRNDRDIKIIVEQTLLWQSSCEEELTGYCQGTWLEQNEVNQMAMVDQTDGNTKDVISHPNGQRTGRGHRQGTVPTSNVNQTTKASKRGKSLNDDENNDDQSNNRRPTRPLSRSNPSYSKLNQRAPTFFIGGHNGVKMVEATLTSLGWKRILDNNDRNFYLKWVECKKNLDFATFREGEQLVNHIPNGNLLTTKIGLLTSLEEFERVSCRAESRASKLFQMKDFFPETYKLQSQTEIEQFINQVYRDGEVWICKPTGMNQGKGIFLIRNQSELEKRFRPKLESRNQRYSPSPGRIIQRYISNPLLLNGFKADIRTYMLIAGTCPYMVFYHTGYVRLSVVPYSLHHEEIHAHLTNQYIQKKHPLYQEVKEETVWSLDKLQDCINETYNTEGILPRDWVYTNFTKRMQEIMLKCFDSVRHKLERKLGFFDLLGFDFMLDENFKVWLIEINVNPALHTNCKILSDVIPELVDGTLRLVIEVFEKSKNKERLLPLENLGKFQLLYNGSKK